MRRRTTILVGVALLLLGAAAALSSRGSLAVAERAPAGETGSGWTPYCFVARPRADRKLLDRCVRLRGRVLWVRRTSKEIHAAVLADFHLFIVKVVPPFPAHLGIGSAIDAVGPLLRTKYGLREVQAFHLEAG